MTTPEHFSFYAAGALIGIFIIATLYYFLFAVFYMLPANPWIRLVYRGTVIAIMIYVVAHLVGLVDSRFGPSDRHMRNVMIGIIGIACWTTFISLLIAHRRRASG
jgi:uncharacterized membrane protein YagU involved in acid resistance